MTSGTVLEAPGRRARLPGRAALNPVVPGVVIQALVVAVLIAVIVAEMVAAAMRRAHGGPTPRSGWRRRSRGPSAASTAELVF